MGFMNIARAALISAFVVTAVAGAKTFSFYLEPPDYTREGLLSTIVCVGYPRTCFSNVYFVFEADFGFASVANQPRELCNSSLKLTQENYNAWKGFSRTRNSTRDVIAENTLLDVSIGVTQTSDKLNVLCFQQLLLENPQVVLVSAKMRSDLTSRLSLSDSPTCFRPREMVVYPMQPPYLYPWTAYDAATGKNITFDIGGRQQCSVPGFKGSLFDPSYIGASVLSSFSSQSTVGLLPYNREVVFVLNGSSSRVLQASDVVGGAEGLYVPTNDDLPAIILGILSLCFAILCGFTSIMQQFISVQHEMFLCLSLGGLRSSAFFVAAIILTGLGVGVSKQANFQASIWEFLSVDATMCTGQRGDEAVYTSLFVASACLSLVSSFSIFVGDLSNRLYAINLVCLALSTTSMAQQYYTVSWLCSTIPALVLWGAIGYYFSASCLSQLAREMIRDKPHLYTSTSPSSHYDLSIWVYRIARFFVFCSSLLTCSTLTGSVLLPALGYYLSLSSSEILLLLISYAFVAGLSAL